jgi:16S rRNA processing protein RimM
MEVFTDFPERVSQLRYLYVGKDRQRYQLQGVRSHKAALLLKLQGCDDRDTAASLRGALVQIVIQDAVPLEQDEYYQFQLVGVQAETEDGEVLGEVVDVLSVPGANDVYVVHGAYGELLLPAIQEVVLDLDLEARRMRVHLIPGLLDLD